MFVDASVLVAVLGNEQDSDDLMQRLGGAAEKFVSPLAIWEAIRGLHRSIRMPLDDAERLVRDLLEAGNISIVAIDDETGREAVRASRLFGKGRHQAALNMGDCFAYACARQLGVPLLAKGNDFPRTDIELA